MNPTHVDKTTSYVTALQALKDDDRLRGLKPRAGIDFASNDYLALASAPRMRKAVAAALEADTPIGSGGLGRLVGNRPEHESPTAEAAPFFLAAAALFFFGPLASNFPLLPTPPPPSALLCLP